MIKARSINCEPTKALNKTAWDYPSLIHTASPQALPFNSEGKLLCGFVKIETFVDLDQIKNHFVLHFSGPYFKVHSFSVEFINKQYQPQYKIHDIRMMAKNPSLRGRLCILVINPQTQNSNNDDSSDVEAPPLLVTNNSLPSANSREFHNQKLSKADAVTIVDESENSSENEALPASLILPRTALISLYLKSYF